MEDFNFLEKLMELVIQLKKFKEITKIILLKKENQFQNLKNKNQLLVKLN